jgi:hypothetical protein
MRKINTVRAPRARASETLFALTFQKISNYAARRTVVPITCKC